MSNAKKCKLCRCDRTRWNGIETTLGWFCYECVKRFRRQTAALDEQFDKQAKELQAESA